MPARGSLGYENAWRTFHITSNKLFDHSSGVQPILGGLAIKIDADATEVVVSAGGAPDGVADEGVYRYKGGLLTTTGTNTQTPYIPMPGIAFPGGFYVDIGTSPGVTVLYKGEHD